MPFTSIRARYIKVILRLESVATLACKPHNRPTDTPPPIKLILVTTYFIHLTRCEIVESESKCYVAMIRERHSTFFSVINLLALCRTVKRALTSADSISTSYF